MDLLRSLGEKAAVLSKTIAREAEIVLGKVNPRPLKARAQMRAELVVKAVAPLLKHKDGVTPFPSARTRAMLKAVKPRRVEKLKGSR